MKALPGQWRARLRHGAQAARMAADLRAALFLSPRDLASLRQQRLIQTVTHAYETVPYYRRLLGSAGLGPTDIRTESDLRRIPVTTKDDLRSLPSADVVSSSVQPQQLRRHITSGSTGVPFVFYRTIDTELHRVLGHYRVFLTSGVRWRDRLLLIGMSPVFEGRWFQRLGILPTRVVRAVTPVEEQVQILLSFRPTVLVCWPSAGRTLAATLLRTSADMPSIRRIFTGGEALDQGTTDLMVRVFGAAPLSIYGCLEVGNIGWQCRPGGAFHTGDDVVMVEVVRDGEPVGEGELGELAVTALARRDMPFIRYCTGDLARRVARSCACQHAFGQIELVGGRVSEVLVLPDGGLRSALEVTAIVHKVPGVTHFQLQQDRPDQLRILLVAAGPIEPAAVDRLRADLLSLLPGVAMLIEQVPDIPRGPGGKLSYVLVSPALRARASLAPREP